MPSLTSRSETTDRGTSFAAAIADHQATARARRARLMVADPNHQGQRLGGVSHQLQLARHLRAPSTDLDAS